MMDNQDNLNGVAPINGEQNGPVWEESGSFGNYMAKLRAGQLNTSASWNSSAHEKRASGSWIAQLSGYGKVGFQVTLENKTPTNMLP